MRADDAQRQDIVRMVDIVDASNQSLSWRKLVEILETDDDFGLAFKEAVDF